MQLNKTVELPKDADGELIQIGDVVYGNPDVAWLVTGLRMSKVGWKVEMDNVPFLYEPDSLTHKKPEPPDSWERLEDDVFRLVTRGYLDRPEEDAKSIIRRAKVLAKVDGAQ